MQTHLSISFKANTYLMTKSIFSSDSQNRNPRSLFTFFKKLVGKEQIVKEIGWGSTIPLQLIFI